MEKRYFYFQDPHSFAYPLVAKLIIFKDRISSLRVQSKWMEVNDYIYYGEPVTCLIPAKHMEYDFVFSLLSSDNSDNIFGAVNYMLRNWYRRFLAGNTEQFIYYTVENNEPILVFSPQKSNYWKIDSVWKHCDEPALIKEEILAFEVHKLLNEMKLLIEA